MKSGDVKETVQDLEAEFNPNDQELCNAATKIQASFRGHMARKQAPAATGGKGKPEDDLSKELQKLDAKTEDELADIDLDDPELHKAASKIQATFRRRLMPAKAPHPVQSAAKTEDDDLADIDLEDPELHKAASKIQATFRRRMLPAKPQPAAKTEEDDLADIDLDDPELHKAASKIQATFRKRLLPAKFGSASKQSQPQQKTEEEDDLADIDLEDPELHKAASKIQATFRRRLFPSKASPQHAAKESP